MLTIGNSYQYTVPINFLVTPGFAKEIISADARIELSPTRLVTLTNVEEAEAQPEIIFNAVLVYDIQ